MIDPYHNYPPFLSLDSHLQSREEIIFVAIMKELHHFHTGISSLLSLERQKTTLQSIILSIDNYLRENSNEQFKIKYSDSSGPREFSLFRKLLFKTREFFCCFTK